MRRGALLGIAAGPLLAIAALGPAGCRLPASGGRPPSGASPRPIAGAAAPLIRTYIGAGRVPGVGAFTAAERADMRLLYGRRADPLWVDAGGRPTADARQALTVIDRVADDGLTPADYPAAELRHLAAALSGPAPAPAIDLARFDAGTSWAMLRYFRQVHVGRVNPADAGFRRIASPEAHDFAALLGDAMARHRILDAAADLAPPFAQYRKLRRALARYRTLAADPSLSALPEPKHAVHPGDAYEGAAALYRRLSAEGDIPPDADPPQDGTYAGPLVEGVVHFQRRYGLAPDGVIGRNTIAALDVPLARRARQIELAMERLRWVPDLAPGPLIVVNIPMFHLWGWNATPASGPPAVQMDVIVGRAVATETPVLFATLDEVIFRPFWNVPRSITRKEILPDLARKPDYLASNDMEIVDGEGDDARVVPSTKANLAALAGGDLRLRQRPGPDNSLGLVKFVFPNPADVYMHGTPAQQLFAKSRRDFSHGCVRVADPVGLAAWVLGGQPDWPRDRIVAAMNGAATLHVRVARPAQVLLFYNTAAVMPDDGTVHFAADIYGQDQRLEEALAGD